MKTKTKMLVTMLVCTLLIGCASLFQGIVTVTGVVDAAMTNWATLSTQGQTSTEFDAEVVRVYDKYRQGAMLAQVSLNLYKKTGNQADLLEALQQAKEGAGPLIDLIASILQPRQATALKSNLLKATQI